MNPIDLRLGNIISIKETALIELYDTCEISCEAIQSVCLIESTPNGMCHLWIDNQQIEFEYSDIEPVPVTEEWLVKLGFTKPVDTVGGFSRTEKGKVVLLDMRLSPANSIRIDYVHQLQNLYYALTGEELKIPEDEQK